ncbi:MAG TPA: PilN domain-containing protein [Gaiellaceae bacterium]|jgi:Tfp pilus assembly protein PilN|nr:PilN domain-containing protein [Gaiellaceae bacterium]
MRAVNLLPRQQAQRTHERPNAVVLVASIGGAAVVLALVGGFLLANRSADRERQNLAGARAVLAVTPAHHLSASTQTFRSNVLNKKEQRSLALDAALGKRVAWDRILRRFALVLPSDVWLTSLVGTVPLDDSAAAATAVPTSSSLPATPTALTIVGYTYSQDSVARLLERLSVVPDLKNVQLQNSQTAQVAGQTVIQFTIVSDVRKGRGAS